MTPKDKAKELVERFRILATSRGDDDDQTQELLNEARDLMESFDDCAAMTVGYDKKEYTLTAKQMTLIAGALYMADCKLNQNKQLDNLLKQEKEWTATFDSDVRVGLALLDEIRKLNQNKDD